MESNKDKINNLPILEVLDKLGYHKDTHYKLFGKNIRMKDSKGALSDGWIGDTNTNKMYARSGLKEGRFEGDIIGIIKGAMNIEVAEAIKWAENAFNIEKVGFTPKAKKNTLGDKWSGLPLLNEEQVSYLSKRFIEYNEHTKKLYKNNNGAISATINSEGGNVNAIQGRKVGENIDKKFRYQIEKDGDDGTGIFSYFPKPDNKICFVVEGLTDIGTIAQFGVNVIGLVSATAGIRYLKAFDKKYNLIYIPDKDESGIKSIQALDDMGVIYGKFDLDYFGEDVKDVNDAWVSCQDYGIDGQTFLKEIYDGRVAPLRNIDMVIKSAIENRSLGSWNIGDKVFDDAVGGITPRTIMIINGVTGEGKTTTLDWIVTSLLQHNKKIAFCSTDDNVGKMLSMFLSRFFHKSWRKEILPNIEKYVEEYGKDKFDNMLFYDDINDLDSFSNLVKGEGVDLLIIDYIQNIGVEGKDMKEKMQGAVKGLRNIAREHNCAVIALSQCAGAESQKPVTYRNPMESIYIKSEADTFINVGQDPNSKKHKIAFVKNKYGDDEYKNTEHETSWDRQTGKISIFKDFSVDDDLI